MAISFKPHDLSKKKTLADTLWLFVKLCSFKSGLNYH